MWTFHTIILALLVCDFGVHLVPAMVISSSKLIPCEVLPNGMIALIDQSSDDQSSPTLNNSDNQTMCNIPIYSPVIKIGMSTLDEIFTEANKEPAEGSGIATSTAKPATACDGVMVDLDMCLTPAQDREMADDSPRTSTEKPLVRKKRKIVKDPTGRWPHNTIPYEIIENDFTVAELRNIIDAFTEYEIHTCIIFKPATPLDTNKLVIMGGQGCYSNIGMVGGTQRLVLDRGNCRKKRVIMHELGHAIGMVHEHQRWDRDDFITILRKNVRPDVLDQFRKFSQTIVDTTKVPYDYLSIMHYGGNFHGERGFTKSTEICEIGKRTVKIEQFFSKDGISTTIKTNNANYQDLIGRTEQLSFIDIKAVNLMYKCNARCPAANTMVCPWDGFQDKYCECRCSDGQVCQQNPELTNLFIRPSNPFLDQILMPNAGIISGQQQIMYESNPRNYPIEYPYAGHAAISDLVMQPPPYSNFIYDPISLSNLVPNPPFIPSMMQQPSVSVQFGSQNHSVPTTIPTSPTLTETFPVNPTTQSQPNPQPVELTSKEKVTIPSEVKIQTNYTTGKPSIVTNLASVQILNIAATKKPPTPQNEPSINITAMGDVPAVANPFRKQKQAPVNEIHMEPSPFLVVQPKMSVNHHGEVAPSPKSTRSENGPLLSDVQHRQHSLEEKAILFRKIDRQRQNSKRNYLSPPSKEEQALAKLLANEQTKKQTFPKDEQKTPQEKLKMSPLEEQLLKIRAQIIKLEDQRQQRRTQRILESKSQRNPHQLPYQVPADNPQKNSPHKNLQQSHYPLGITSQPLRNVGLFGNRGITRNNRFRGRNHRRFENQNVLEKSRRQPRIQSAAVKKQATSANGHQTIQRSSDLNTPVKRQNTLNRRIFNTGAQNYRRFNSMVMNNNRNSVNNNVPYQQNVNTVQLRQTLNNQPSLGAIRRKTNNVFSAHSRNVASNGQTGSRASNVQRRNGAIFGQSVNRGFSGRNRANLRNQQNTVNSQRISSQRLNNVRFGGYGQNSRSNVNAVSNRHSSLNRQNPQYNIQNRGRALQTQATRNRNIRQNENSQRMFQNSMGIRQNSMRINQNSPPAFNSFRSQQNSQSRGNSRFNQQNSIGTRLGSNRLQYNPSIAVQRSMNRNVRSNNRMAFPNKFNSNDSNVTPRPTAKSAYFVSPFEDRVDSWL